MTTPGQAVVQHESTNTVNGTLTVPSITGIPSYKLIYSVAGGAGGAGGSDAGTTGSGGNPGQFVSHIVTVYPGDVIAFYPGSSGNAGASGVSGTGGGNGGVNTLGYNGGKGGAAGNEGSSGAGGGGGAASVLRINGINVAVGGGGGGGGGSGYQSNGQGISPGGQNATIVGSVGSTDGSDGGGGGGGGGGLNGGNGGSFGYDDQGGYQGGYGGNYSLYTGFSTGSATVGQGYVYLKLTYLPTSNDPISLSDVNIELQYPATQTISLNDAYVRNLAGLPTTNSPIDMYSLKGKSSTVLALQSSGPAFTDNGEGTIGPGWGLAGCARFFTGYTPGYPNSYSVTSTCAKPQRIYCVASFIFGTNNYGQYQVVKSDGTVIGSWPSISGYYDQLQMQGGPRYVGFYDILQPYATNYYGMRENVGDRGDYCYTFNSGVDGVGPMTFQFSSFV